MVWTVESRAREAVIDFVTGRHWSEDEYLLLADGATAFLELSEGRLVVHAMPSPLHQSVVLNLASILRASRLGKVYIAPMPVRLWPDKFREPDLCYYRQEHLDRVGERFGEAPDLVIEVLSPSTRSVDLGEKMDDYARAGIPEYWAIDSDARDVTVYALAGAEYRLSQRYPSSEAVQPATIADVSFQVSQIFD